LKKKKFAMFKDVLDVQKFDLNEVREHGSFEKNVFMNYCPFSIGIYLHQSPKMFDSPLSSAFG